MIGWIVFIFVMIFVLGLIITAVVIYFRFGNLFGSKIPPNSPLIRIFGTRNSGGHSLGVLVSYEQPISGSDNLIVKMRPLDLKYDGEGRPIPVKDIEIPVRKELMTKVPAGGNSLFRDEIYIAPNSPTELDSTFRNTLLGSAIAFGINQLNLKDKAVDMIVERQMSERQALALIKKEEDEIVVKYKEEFGKLLRQNVRERVGGPPSSGGGGGGGGGQG